MNVNFHCWVGTQKIDIKATTSEASEATILTLGEDAGLHDPRLSEESVTFFVYGTPEEQIEHFIQPLIDALLEQRSVMLRIAATKDQPVLPL